MDDRGRPGKLLVIALDAADADLVDRGCREGWLPALRALREAGVWARLRTPAEDLHVAALPSLYTGTPPDRHGLYHAWVMRPGRQVPERTRPDESPEPPVWKLLSDAGRRCVVMDAFMSAPCEPFNGVQILEYGTWTRFWRPMTSPPSLRRVILARFGPYPAEDHARVLEPPDPAGFRARLLRAAATKAEVIRWLMAREPWEFFFVVFGEPHAAGHYLWHLHDPSYPAHPPAGAGTLGHALVDVYAAVDRAIGAIAAAVDPATTVLVVAPDGMGPNYSGSHLLDAVLARLGLAANGRAPGTAAGPAPGGLAARLRARVPPAARAAVSRHLLPRALRERLTLRWMTAHVDWAATRVFPIDNANEGYLRVNLRGREPAGTVAPGAAYVAVCDALVAALGGLVNPRTGRRAARAVWRTDDRYSGPRRDRLPDVVVNWDPGAAVTTELVGERIGLVRSLRGPWEVSPFYTGNHRPAAFLAARGPELPAGLVLDGLDVLDIAPTVLAHFGLPRTPAMTGRVVPALRAGVHA